MRACQLGAWWLRLLERLGRKPRPEGYGHHQNHPLCFPGGGLHLDQPLFPRVPLRIAGPFLPMVQWPERQHVYVTLRYV